VVHRITMIPGDGIGPEVTDAGRLVVEATGVEVRWDVQDIGLRAWEAVGEVVPASAVSSIRDNGVALKGPIETPADGGVRNANVALRQELDLFANVRPCRRYPGVPSVYGDVDLVVVRENIEDTYTGVEFEVGTVEVERLIAFIEEMTDVRIRRDSGISVKAISRSGSERIVRFAFEEAARRGLATVTAGHKANIMKFSDGLFLDVARRVAAQYPDVAFDDRIIDALCMQLVRTPERFQVLVLPNLYGDIVSDLGAGLIGGLGLAPGANIGTEGAIFEATHGSAPKYKGQNKVNPTALMLSGVLMLRHLGETEAAERMESGLAGVIRKGDKVTYDLKPSRDDPSAVGTSEFADAVIEEMGS
jgi:isocitrate dehydrogenase (NAD+)